MLTETCPYDVAWADKASDFDTAHALAECSNNGECNRNTVQGIYYHFEFTTDVCS